MGERRPRRVAGRRAAILIADHQPVMRAGLRAVIESRPGWRITAEAASGAEALRETGLRRPDLLLLDGALPDRSGLEVGRAVLAADPSATILLFTAHESEESLREAEAIGIRGVLLRSRPSSDLLDAIEALLAGGRWPPRSAPGAALSRGLTGREIDVVRRIADGQTTKGIAAALGISVKTADTHRLSAMRKLSAHSVSEIVRFAIRAGLIDP